MTLLSDRWIKENCEKNELITPFVDRSVKVSEDGLRKIPSYGLSSYGYDVRLGRNFTFFKGLEERTNLSYYPDGTPEIVQVQNSEGQLMTSAGLEVFENYKGILDICDFDNECGVQINDVDWIIMPPHSFVLGHTVEKIKVPRDVSVVCMGKSTIARAGIIVTVTPLEAGWEGYVTLEITNTTDIPIKLWSGIGISQLLFQPGNEPCMVSYADRGGKYQNQPQKPVMPTN
jgi:dCTP deaminase